ncbi:cysteine synthase A [Pseudomonas sp. 13B_2.1_Bac1]|uniref:cysteine synthase A n=1 Tax=Pseudomonas sp. 13B_2.1_Bac1 TaxID=2971624 RepID=UPI0021C72300|nr:cysteine synthase A [Pseudomonas sp. 13B_2.1_Bac1]MCU1785286.1 cysteine synthase A [Pseudomonas sp. 13B_2.1_Bac1]
MSTFRGRVYESIIDTIGATPLVRFNRFAAELNIPVQLLGKLEFFNPLSSVKDRLGLALINDAEQSGRLQPGSTIIEPTSGNTGIALAFIAAARGYRLILCMPESMSEERRKMLRFLGAELELTPASQSMSGAIARAHELQKEIPDSIVLQQFENPANPAIHRVTTAEEIWNDTAGEVDIVVAGIGTGGTITGVGEVLKAYKPSVQIIGVEPAGSAVLSGGKPGPHKIQGIGSGFLSKILNLQVIDEFLAISDDDALDTARKIARFEGVPVGISSGAALAAARIIGQRPENEGKVIVTIIPSFAERYLSTALFDEV